MRDVKSELASRLQGALSALRDLQECVPPKDWKHYATAVLDLERDSPFNELVRADADGVAPVEAPKHAITGEPVIPGVCGMPGCAECEQARKVRAAAGVAMPRLRRLTREEVQPLMQNDKHAMARAVQRKFCEVNGITPPEGVSGIAEAAHDPD